MNQELSPIIHAVELLELYHKEELLLVDVSNGKNARENYEKKHLDKALFVDINSQLAAVTNDFKNGGRHPLPNIKDFAQTVSNLGISPTSHVVIYDDKNGSNAAARFWWMLKAIGHEKAQVLNGGIQAAEKIGFPLSSKTETTQKAKLYKVTDWKLPIAEIEEVEKNSQNEDYLVIDVRENSRYSGENEPIDLISGHIPGAINVPLDENLDENGLFLAPTLLKNKYEKLFGKVKPENRIIHCGSGVTACHSILAIAYAGLEIPKLYLGSWSEWSRNNKKIQHGNT